MIATPSRLLANLNAAISAEQDPFERDCLAIERGCYLARQGHIEPARELHQHLRRKYSSEPHVIISSWLNLLEGLVFYFSNLGGQSRDRIMRAHALSKASGFKAMHALSAAWLAQMDFSRLRIDLLDKYVRESLEQATPDNNSALARSSLVIAHALHVGGRYDLALPWYRSAHSHATVQGDDATISAIMLNMPSMHFENLRQARFLGKLELEKTSHILLSAQSSNNFDTLFNAQSLESLRPLLRARICGIDGRPTEAIELYKLHILPVISGELARMASEIYSDLANCYLLVGDSAAASQYAELAMEGITPDTQIDDRAATHSRLARVYEQLGQSDKALMHRAKSKDAWTEFESVQTSIVACLGALKPVAPQATLHMQVSTPARDTGRV
jgi:ATP/maltotriose-dependent transcriptional regulator MalT